MNSLAHSKILKEALNAIPNKYLEGIVFDSDTDLINKVGNYPDFFASPIRTDEGKAAIDPRWRDYSFFGLDSRADDLHSWLRLKLPKTKLIQHYLEAMIESLKNKQRTDFIKYTGCLSHFFGDTLQPAHLDIDSAMSLTMELLPVPDSMNNIGFNYHTRIEAVTGECSPLDAPQIQGRSIQEAAWRLNGRLRQGESYCRRFIVLIVQALFDNDQAEASAAASIPLTAASQATADAILTSLSLAGVLDASANIVPDVVDLRDFRPDEEYQDMVYGAKAIIDGNRNARPNLMEPVQPGKLNTQNGITEFSGLGVLPHSGMDGPLESWMRWDLPENTFHIFTSLVGMHAELGLAGAVEFELLVDDHLAWRSGRMLATDIAKKVEVNISNANSITLKVVDANNRNTFWDNHAFWAEPQLVI